jgi:hypothetical protein
MSAKRLRIPMNTTNFNAADAEIPIVSPGAIARFSIGDVLPHWWNATDSVATTRDNKNSLHLNGSTIR